MLPLYQHLMVVNFIPRFVSTSTSRFGCAHSTSHFNSFKAGCAIILLLLALRYRCALLLTSFSFTTFSPVRCFECFKAHLSRSSWLLIPSWSWQLRVYMVIIPYWVHIRREFALNINPNRKKWLVHIVTNGDS